MMSDQSAAERVSDLRWELLCTGHLETHEAAAQKRYKLACDLIEVAQQQIVALRTVTQERDTARAEAQALREQLESLKQERAWRPIETAPRDGAEVPCWCPGIGARVLFFDDDHVERTPLVNRVLRVKRGRWLLSGTNDYDPYEPTHWMPLPPAPEVD